VGPDLKENGARRSANCVWRWRGPSPFTFGSASSASLWVRGQDGILELHRQVAEPHHFAVPEFGRQTLTERRALILGAVGVAGLTAWRYRLLQVAGYTVVAGMRRKVSNDRPPDFQALAPQWSALKPTRTHLHVRSRGMITYHPWYDDFDPVTANNCLAATAELGAGYIRLDIRWKDVLPDGRGTNEAAWTWYHQYLLAARDWYGLEPLIVLYNPPKTVLNSPLFDRLAAWSRYVDEVGSRTGHMCNIYQLLNEPNNPVFKVFPLEIAPAAIATGAKILRHYNPDSQITINVLAGLLGWHTDLEKLVRASGSAIDIVGLDYYPGTWTVSSNSDIINWNRLIEQITTTRASKNSPLYGRPVAILETGYATNVRWCRDEEQQVRFLKDLGRAMESLDRQIGPVGLVLVGIHELSDADTHVLLDPEAHFGLLASRTLRRKRGFEVTKELFRAL